MFHVAMNSLITHRIRLLGLALALLLGTTAGLPAQEEAAVAEVGDLSAQEGYIESVNVNVVNVDVYVTDKKGNPITGLTPDDFEVTEDRRPVTITNFYEVRDGSRIGEDGEPLMVPSTTPTLDAGPVPLIEPTQKLNLVVYIDNFNIRPFNRNRVFRRLRTFLREQLDENDRVMLVSYDRSLKVRQTFTNNVSLINSQLFELETVSGHGVHADSERNRVMREILESEDVGGAMLALRPHAESLFNDVSFTFSAIEGLIDNLAGLEGRKALLYVSDGVPMKAAEDLFYMVQQMYHYTPVITEMLDFDSSRVVRTIGNKANSNGITFYTIDAAGLRTLSSASVETRGDEDTPGLSSFVDTIYVQNLQDPLRFLADATGGRAIINANDIADDLLKIASDFDAYYSLGYTPAHSGDGRLHKIQVKLKDKKGRRIRHRNSYRDKSTDARMIDGTTAALRYGFEQNSMGVVLEVGSARPTPDGYFHVPVKVGIPLDRVTLVPRTDYYYGRTRLYLGAIDDEESVSEISNLEIPIRIPSDALEEVQGMYFPYETTLLMRGGPHQIAIGIRDELGASSSYVKRSFMVGSG